jgi:hypothetical protein
MLVLDAADLTRMALFTFLEGAEAGWTEEDVVNWLDEEYALATSFGKRQSRERRARCASIHEHQLALVRQEILDLVMGAATSWVHAALAEELTKAGLVMRVQDHMTATGYIHLDLPDIPLFERVASLFVADYLTRPSDYGNHLVVCSSCASVSFDWAPSHGARCPYARAVKQSGIVPRSEDVPPKLGNGWR